MSQMNCAFPQQSTLGGFSSCSFNPQPQSAAELGREGDALLLRHQFLAAQEKYLAARELDPQNPNWPFGLAFCKWHQGRSDEAGHHLQDAVKIDPKHARAQAALASWYLIHGMSEAADHTSALAYELDPKNLDVVTARCDILEHKGDPEAVCEILRKSAHFAHPTPGYARLVAKMARRRGNVPEALAMIMAVLKTGGAAVLETSALHLTAAGLLDGMGRYDEAFEHVRIGNSVRRVQWNPDDGTHMVDRAIRYFSRNKLKALCRSNETTSLPVYVVGFVRSGTSLVEQILASHPSVHGGGELDLLHWTEQATMKMLGANSAHYPACLDRLTTAQADGLAQSLLGPLNALNPQSERIVDKMPFNGLHLGLVQMLLPGARIIHCRRDPLDTCLSAHMTQFSHGNAFKYEQNHVGRFHRDYERLMEHWKSVLDIPILDVHYEKLVHNVEGESRRLVEFLGLPWDDRCARFYETKRYVATASSEQVRKPPYASSIGRWQHYTRHIGPMRAALGL